MIIQILLLLLYIATISFTQDLILFENNNNKHRILTTGTQDPTTYPSVQLDTQNHAIFKQKEQIQNIVIDVQNYSRHILLEMFIDTEKTIVNSYLNDRVIFSCNFNDKFNSFNGTHLKNDGG